MLLLLLLSSCSFVFLVRSNLTFYPTWSNLQYEYYSYFESRCTCVARVSVVGCCWVVLCLIFPRKRHTVEVDTFKTCVFVYAGKASKQQESSKNEGFDAAIIIMVIIMKLLNCFIRHSVLYIHQQTINNHLHSGFNFTINKH